MITIEIRKETVAIQAEEGMTSYESLNISGRGKLVAKVKGDMIAQKDWQGVDEVGLDGYTWALRDILWFAKRGQRGLTIA